MNFNLGDWVVKALELIERSRVLRRLVYMAMAVIVMSCGGPFVSGIARLVEALK